MFFAFIPICSAEKLPEIKFDDTSYNFGIAGPGEEIKHIFKFINTGTSLLEIENISTDCGCTAALISNQKILPNGKGEIEITFKTGRYEGKQKGTITIYSNDLNNKKVSLIVEGEVKRDIAVIPEGLALGDIEQGKSINNTVKILQLSSEALVINKLEFNKKYIDVKKSLFEDKNSRGIKLDISLKDNILAGIFNEIITIHTNLKKYPKLDIPIWGNIIGGIQVIPSSFSFGKVLKGVKFSEYITILSKDKKNLEGLKITCDLPFIKTNLLPDKDNKSIKIELYVDKISPSGKISSQLTIHTNDPLQKIIKIPIYGLIK
ncbi:DUF1573 domain-containing protein [Desulfonema limicola]|nr:DUF1573 domain-containing protein [Desulfonema limicola]